MIHNYRTLNFWLGPVVKSIPTNGQIDPNQWFYKRYRAVSSYLFTILDKIIEVNKLKLLYELLQIRDDFLVVHE